MERSKCDLSGIRQADVRSGSQSDARDVVRDADPDVRTTNSIPLLEDHLCVISNARDFIPDARDANANIRGADDPNEKVCCHDDNVKRKPQCEDSSGYRLVP